jgi:phosphopantothenoylcysteine decarboxylase/phosphopantothenate--cysteine ligase
MGFAIAETLAAAGAEVYLVSGPTHLSVNHPLIHRTDINTAQEMYNACIKLFPQCDAAILSAAVADYRVKEVSPVKIKKTAEGNESLILELVKNKDILATLGSMKQKGQILAGFSLETNDAEKFAVEKLRKKNCDMIVMNTLEDKGAGFAYDTNKISILSSDGQQKNFPLKTKKEVAIDIVDFITHKYFQL